MEKLDLKDKKLLYFLSQNCRLSHTQLSKKISLNKNTIAYRIERLKKLKIISKFASVINLNSLNLSTITLLLKFNDDIYENKEIIEYFQNHEFANWLISLSGQYDLFVEFVIKDFEHLDNIIDDLLIKFNNTLNSYQVFLSNNVLRVEHLVERFYQDIKIEEVPQQKRSNEKFKIDKIDKKILNILNQDSSLPYLQIAKKINSTIDIVRYRINNLTKKKIIIKSFSEINLKKLGYTEYLYTLKLKNLTKEKKEKIMTRITEHKNITYAFMDSTSFNIMFVCAFKNTDNMDHLSRNLRKEFSDIIETQDYQIIKEQLLFNLFPRGLL